MSAALALRDVSKAFLADEVRTAAVKNVSLEIAAGELVAITGPSGCGKSTLLSLMGLLERPDSGSIQILGEETRARNESDLARFRRGKISFIFQNFNLIDDLTVQENVEIGLVYQPGKKTMRQRSAAHMLEYVGLAHRARHRPPQLSGGQQQRVAIARALASNAEIILADEPTGNLDSSAGEAIMQLLLALPAQGKSVALVTHSPDLAARAQRRLAMRDGSLHEVIG